MTSLAAPRPIAVEHAGHPGPLVECPICRPTASYGAFRRRYWTLRGRRGVSRSRLVLGFSGI